MDSRNLKQAFNITLGQCSELLRQNLEAEVTYDSIESDADVIELLKLIQAQIYNYQSHKYPPEAVHEAIQKFYTLSQENMDNQTYINEFRSQIEVIDTVGGWVGIHPTLTTEILRKIIGRQDISADKADQELEAREKEP